MDIRIEPGSAFSASISFDATPTNSVQIVFGRDFDLDGDLSWDEASLKVGWNAGEWIASSPATGETATAPADGAASRRTLSISAFVCSDGSARDFSLRDGDAAILPASASFLLPAIRLDLWNRAKVVSRGAGMPEQAIVTARRAGAVFFLK